MGVKGYVKRYPSQASNYPSPHWSALKMDAAARRRESQAAKNMQDKSGPYYERYVERMTRSFVKTAHDMGYRVLNEAPWIEKA